MKKASRETLMLKFLRESDKVCCQWGYWNNISPSSLTQSGELFVDSKTIHNQAKFSQPAWQAGVERNQLQSIAKILQLIGIAKTNQN